MGPSEVRAAIAQLAASQWGLVTAAQATSAGATRMLLTRMVDNGELDRVVYGVYAVPTALTDEHLEKRALWLSLDPSRSAEERLARRHEAGVLSHATAAALHGIGDILDDYVEITTPRRQQTRRAELKLHRAELRPDEVTSVEGLPTTTAPRTIADLIVAGHDRDHVATVMSEAIRGDLASVEQISEALERRLGSDRAQQALAELLAAAGLDEASLEKAVISSPIGRRALENMQADSLLAMLAPKLWTGVPALELNLMPKVDLKPLVPDLLPLVTPELWRAIEGLLPRVAPPDAFKRTTTNAKLAETLGRMSRSHFADLRPGDLTPLLARSGNSLAAGDRAVESADSPDEPGRDEEADQLR